MSKGKNPALAPGRYVSKDPEASIAVWNARARLIGSIKEVLPEFLSNLAIEVFPLYASRDELSYESWYEQWEKAFNAWAARFNVGCDWLKDLAFRTLDGWRTDPIALENLEWNHPVYSRTVLIVPGFQCEGWVPEFEKLDDFEERIRSQFEEFLSRTKSASLKLVDDGGLVPSPRQYSPQNLDWLIRYQFAGMSYGQIAELLDSKDENWGGDASTVRKGVAAAARLLALNLRSGSRTKMEAPPKPTEATLRNAVQAALDADDTGAYIDAANALDVYEAEHGIGKLSSQ